MTPIGRKLTVQICGMTVVQICGMFDHHHAADLRQGVSILYSIFSNLLFSY